MSRKTRTIKKGFKIFCEGDTEYNYFDKMKKVKNLSLFLNPINMKGGGYNNFLHKLKEDSNSNCLAKFIILDGDRAVDDLNELKNLKKIVEYCQIQNKCDRIPHILIINCPDFEYVACLHSKNYKGKDIKNFILKEYRKKDLDGFKADKNVYDLLNSNNNSYNVMLKNINRNNSAVINAYKIIKRNYEVKSILSFRQEKISMRGSNIYDLFEILKEFESSV